MITVLFSWINLSVSPNPIPLAPPVIRILLFINFIISVLKFYTVVALCGMPTTEVNEG
jgi:hypothetical protein